ncbi:hypothetical protein [Nocardia sp. NPDC019395]|uniref:hypothetical protein n=1 Tax=Nocardia sp. NPDC019395 TaxID=3154686 RepID=UPI0033C7B773
MSTGDQSVGMDGPALTKMANDMRTSAGVVKGQVGSVVDHMVGSADTGFAYKTQGDNIHAGLETVQAWLNDWSEATQLSGDAMGQTVLEISTVDQENAVGTQQAAS